MKRLWSGSLSNLLTPGRVYTAPSVPPLSLPLRPCPILSISPCLFFSSPSSLHPPPPSSSSSSSAARQQHKQSLSLLYYHLPLLHPSMPIENHSLFLFLISILSTYMSPPCFQVWCDTLHSDWILVLLPEKEFLAPDGRQGWMEEADGSLEGRSSWLWTVSFSVSHNKGRLVCQHSSCTSSFCLFPSSCLSYLFLQVSRLILSFSTFPLNKKKQQQQQTLPVSSLTLSPLLWYFCMPLYLPSSLPLWL